MTIKKKNVRKTRSKKNKGEGGEKKGKGKGTRKRKKEKGKRKKKRKGSKPEGLDPIASCVVEHRLSRFLINSIPLFRKFPTFQTHHNRLLQNEAQWRP